MKEIQKQIKGIRIRNNYRAFVVGRFKFIDILKQNVSASITTRNLNNEENEILEIIGNGTRTFQRKDSVETTNNYQIIEIYSKNIGLYYYAESSHYPQYEGIEYKRQINVEELKKILQDSNMTFFGNCEP